MAGTLDYKPEYRRNLPHIQPEGATFFVTTRLAGSLPIEVVMRLEEQQRLARQTIKQMVIPIEEKQSLLYDEDKRFFGRYDRLLDAGNDGPVWLSDSRVAALVCEAIHYRDAQEYDLLAYCVMPNHAHLVFTPLPKADGQYHALSRIMMGLKGNSARRANRTLGRVGAFWQQESYDHYVRGGRELERIVAYVLNNPVKAGLASSWEEWPWSWYRPQITL